MKIKNKHLKTKRHIKSVYIEKNLTKNRINDGKTDQRETWFGTMDNPERFIKKGSLYCLDKDLNVHKIDTNCYVTNGPAFLDKIIFIIPIVEGIIYKIKMNKYLKILKKEIFIRFNSKVGAPDGMTLDKKNLWVCHFNGACISVFNKEGKKIHKINFPAKNITNCTFGGKKNNELFVSTATKSMSKKDYKKYRYSGSFFSIKTNMKGLTQKKFFFK